MGSPNPLIPFLAVASAAAVVGCVSNTPPQQATNAQPEVVGKAVIEARNPAVGLDPNVSIPVTGPVTQHRAIALAMAHHPDIAASSHVLLAADALVLQAGRLPNPTLEVGVEEYDRGGAGFDSAEYEVAVTQQIELGGERRWRERVAEAEAQLAAWDFADTRLEIAAEATRRFMEVVAARQRRDLAEATVKVAEQSAHAVADRVAAGKEPPLSAVKADSALEIARMQALAAEDALAMARLGLAAMWGEETARFEIVGDEFRAVPESVPTLADLRTRMPRSPELARREAEVTLRKAVLAAEKAARIPDIEASVGFQRFEEDETDAITFGVGFPIPLFDSNRGNITAANHALERARIERDAFHLSLRVDLARAHAAFVSAHRRVRALRSRVVSAMEQAVAAAREGYRQGKFGFLDLLDAQRSLYESRAALVDAVAEYHAAVVEIERITAGPIHEPTDTLPEDPS